MTDLWYPANRIERKLAWALASGNLVRYFEILTAAELFQPLGPAGGSGPDGRELVTLRLSADPVLPVFTSYEAMTSAMTGDVAAVALTGYPELRDNWPDPGWLLGVDPGLPIEAYLPVAAVARGLRDELELDHPEVLIGRLGDSDWEPWPAGGANQAVLDAATPHPGRYTARLASRRLADDPAVSAFPGRFTARLASRRLADDPAVAGGDAAEYLDALLDAMVTTATTRPTVEPPVLLGGGFPWQPAGPPGSPVIELFTDQDAFAAAYPGRPSATLRCLSLLLDWPAGHALSVNPGGPAGLDLPAAGVPLLLRWVRAAPADDVAGRVPPELLDGMRWAREREPGPGAADYP